MKRYRHELTGYTITLMFDGRLWTGVCMEAGFVHSSSSRDKVFEVLGRELDGLSK